MRALARIATSSLLLALFACAGANRTRPPAAGAIAPADPRAAITILVSIDGFRPDYLHHGHTPNLDALADTGVSARMQPSFPTITFPNHYAIATGLRPDRNGMVENAMRDPTHAGPRFDIHDPATARDPFWWNEAEPIWVTAEKAGIPTATMMWPGSDALIANTRPSTWATYDAAITSAQRTDAVIDWARRPATNRPKLITLYFDIVDKTSHSDGIVGAPIEAAIGEVDRQIGRLSGGLASIGQPTNLIVVSDHGMENVPPEHVMPLNTLIDPATMEPIALGGPIIAVWPKPGAEAAVAVALLRPHPHATCRWKADLPVRWHFGTNRRIPPFYCLADAGWRYSDAAAKDHPIGDHGFDNADPAMAALFVANGPAFRAHVTLSTFDNVDVYPLVRRLVGLPRATGIDGVIEPLRGALR